MQTSWELYSPFQELNIHQQSFSVVSTLNETYQLPGHLSAHRSLSLKHPVLAGIITKLYQ